MQISTERTESHHRGGGGVYYDFLDSQSSSCSSTSSSEVVVPNSGADIPCVVRNQQKYARRPHLVSRNTRFNKDIGSSNSSGSGSGGKVNSSPEERQVDGSAAPSPVAAEATRGKPFASTAAHTAAKHVNSSVVHHPMPHRDGKGSNYVGINGDGSSNSSNNSNNAHANRVNHQASTHCAGGDVASSYRVDNTSSARQDNKGLDIVVAPQPGLNVSRDSRPQVQHVSNGMHKRENEAKAYDRSSPEPAEYHRFHEPSSCFFSPVAVPAAPGTTTSARTPTSAFDADTPRVGFLFDVSAGMSTSAAAAAVNTEELHLSHLLNAADAALEQVFAQLRRIMLAEHQLELQRAQSALPRARALLLDGGECEQDAMRRELDEMVAVLERLESSVAARATGFVRGANMLGLRLVNEGKYSYALQTLLRAEAVTERSASKTFKYIPEPEEMQAEAGTPLAYTLDPRQQQQQRQATSLFEVALDIHAGRVAGHNGTGVLPELEVSVPYYAPSLERERLAAVAAIENNMGLYHFNLAEYALAAERLARSIAIEEEQASIAMSTGGNVDQAAVANTIGITYFNLAQAQHACGDRRPAARSITLAEEAVERKVHHANDAVRVLKRQYEEHERARMRRTIGKLRGNQEDPLGQLQQQRYESSAPNSFCSGTAADGPEEWCYERLQHQQQQQQQQQPEREGSPRSGIHHHLLDRRPRSHPVSAPYWKNSRGDSIQISSHSGADALHHHYGANYLVPCKDESEAERQHLIQVWLGWREEVCLLSRVKEQHGRWLQAAQKPRHAIPQYEQSIRWLASISRLSPEETRRIADLKQRVMDCKKLVRVAQVEGEMYNGRVEGGRKASSQHRHEAPLQGKIRRARVPASVGTLQSRVVTSVLPKRVQVIDEALPRDKPRQHPSRANSRPSSAIRRRSSAAVDAQSNFASLYTNAAGAGANKRATSRGKGEKYPVPRAASSKQQGGRHSRRDPYHDISDHHEQTHKQEHQKRPEWNADTVPEDNKREETSGRKTKEARAALRDDTRNATPGLQQQHQRIAGLQHRRLREARDYSESSSSAAAVAKRAASSSSSAAATPQASRPAVRRRDPLGNEAVFDAVTGSPLIKAADERSFGVNIAGAHVEASTQQRMTRTLTQLASKAKSKYQREVVEPNIASEVAKSDKEAKRGTEREGGDHEQHGHPKPTERITLARCVNVLQAFAAARMSVSLIEAKMRKSCESGHTLSHSDSHTITVSSSDYSEEKIKGPDSLASCEGFVEEMRTRELPEALETRPGTDCSSPMRLSSAPRGADVDLRNMRRSTGRGDVDSRAAQPVGSIVGDDGEKGVIAPNALQTEDDAGELRRIHTNTPSSSGGAPHADVTLPMEQDMRAEEIGGDDFQEEHHVDVAAEHSYDADVDASCLRPRSDHSLGNGEKLRRIKYYGFSLPSSSSTRSSVSQSSFANASSDRRPAAASQASSSSSSPHSRRSSNCSSPLSSAQRESSPCASSSDGRASKGEVEVVQVAQPPACSATVPKSEVDETHNEPHEKENGLTLDAELEVSDTQHAHETVREGHTHCTACEDDIMLRQQHTNVLSGGHFDTPEGLVAVEVEEEEEGPGAQEVEMPEGDEGRVVANTLQTPRCASKASLPETSLILNQTPITKRGQDVNATECLPSAEKVALSPVTTPYLLRACLQDSFSALHTVAETKVEEGPEHVEAPLVDISMPINVAHDTTLVPAPAYLADPTDPRELPNAAGTHRNLSDVRDRSTEYTSAPPDHRHTILVNTNDMEASQDAPAGFSGIQGWPGGHSKRSSSRLSSAVIEAAVAAQHSSALDITNTTAAGSPSSTSSKSRSRQLPGVKGRVMIFVGDSHCHSPHASMLSGLVPLDVYIPPQQPRQEGSSALRSDYRTETFTNADPQSLALYPGLSRMAGRYQKACTPSSLSRATTSHVVSTSVRDHVGSVSEASQTESRFAALMARLLDKGNAVFSNSQADVFSATGASSQNQWSACGGEAPRSVPGRAPTADFVCEVPAPGSIPTASAERQQQQQQQQSEFLGMNDHRDSTLPFSPPMSGARGGTSHDTSRQVGNAARRSAAKPAGVIDYTPYRVSDSNQEEEEETEEDPELIKELRQHIIKEEAAALIQQRWKKSRGMSADR